MLDDGMDQNLTVLDRIQGVIVPKLSQKPWYKVLGDVCLVSLSVAVGVYGTLAFLDYFGLIPKNWPKSQGILAVFALILFSVCCGLSLALVRIYRLLCKVSSYGDYGNYADSSRLSDELVSHIRDFASKDLHVEVIRLGSVLSTPFWLSGRFQERIDIGKELVHAASIEGNIRAQLNGLIDMTGWTNVVIGNIDTAERNLLRAIDIAQENEQPYMLAKAYRHLGGIRYMQNRMPEALELLRKAESIAEVIVESRDSLEMLAGIEFGKAEINRRTGNFDIAFEYNSKCQQLYIEAGEEGERTLKVDVQYGRLLLATDKVDNARNIFLRIIGRARDQARPQFQAVALEEIGRIYEIENNADQAVEHLRRAVQIYEEIGAVFGITRVQDKIARLSKS